MFGLDVSQTYLVVINTLAFLVFTIDFWIYVHAGNGAFNHAVLNIFAIASGAGDVLLSFLVWDGRIRKDNIAWRFLLSACACLGQL